MAFGKRNAAALPASGHPAIGRRHTTAPSASDAERRRALEQLTAEVRAERGPEGSFAVPAVLALFLLLIPVAWLGAYASGVLPWLGYASESVTSFGVPGKPPFAIIGSDRSGFGFGPAIMPLVAGQEFFVRYRVNARKGRLEFHFGPPSLHPGRGTERRTVGRGSGEIVFRVPKTGIYEFRRVPASDGHGYDLDYELSWGARPAR